MVNINRGPSGHGGWRDDNQKSTEPNWMNMTSDHDKWRQIGEAYIQKWSAKRC